SRTSCLSSRAPEAPSPARGLRGTPRSSRRPSRRRTRNNRIGTGSTAGECRSPKQPDNRGRRAVKAPSWRPGQQGLLDIAGDLVSEGAHPRQVPFAGDRGEIASRFVQPARRGMEERRAVLVREGRTGFFLQERRG